MKYHWEEKDIICGRIVCKEPTKHFIANGWSAKWTHKIGYTGGSSTFDKEGAGVCLIAMTDGMVGHSRSKVDLASYLNEQGMIPMPHEWLIKVVNYLRGCYEHNG